MMNLYDQLHEWVLQQIVLPFLFQFGLMSYAEDSYAAVDWLFLGILQILIIALVFRQLEVNESTMNPQINDAKGTVYADIFYCLIQRLGIFQLIFFISLNPIFSQIGAWLHDERFQRFNLENLIPGVSDFPVIVFLMYLVFLDFVDYNYHRLSHQFNSWWKLHALHHSQMHMTSWSDTRNHFLDDLLRSLVFSSIALLIGIEPSQFVLLVAISHLIQSWQHGFYPYQYGLLKYFIVTPSFHRYHHALRLGYEVPGKPGILGGCNFGVLFPWWDIIFHTAIFDESYHPTGIDYRQTSNHPLTQQLAFFKDFFNEIKGLLRLRGLV